MSRIRTIQPSFPRSRSVSRLSHEARLLFVLLWTIADDAGRTRAAPHELALLLYPSELEMAQFLPAWLDELEHEGCIERYVVDDVVHLRVVNWRKYQKIDHPTASRLPPSPGERRHDSRNPREASRKLRETDGNALSERALLAEIERIREVLDKAQEGDEAATDFTAERVLRDFDRLQRLAEADRSHTAAIRATEMIGRGIGMLGGRGAPAGKKEPASRSPTLEELHGRNPDGTKIAGA